MERIESKRREKKGLEYFANVNVQSFERESNEDESTHANARVEDRRHGGNEDEIVRRISRQKPSKTRSYINN